MNINYDIPKCHDKNVINLQLSIVLTRFKKYFLGKKIIECLNLNCNSIVIPI